MTSLYEHAGGATALLALAGAHHTRCLADPELNHPFTHSDLNPEHVARLAAYWGEVLGGPPTYSTTCGTQTDLIAMHSGNGDMTDAGARFVACFVAAMDDVGLPDDERFRTTMRAYMEWEVREFNRYPEDASTVPPALRTPRWDWSGPVTS